MSTLKIGLVLDDTLDKPDGVQQYVLRVGAWLSAQGHEVHYLVGQSKRNDVQHVHSLARNVRVAFNGNHLSIPLPASRRKIKQLLAREKFDVLHVQMPHSPFMAQLVVCAAPAATRIIGTFHIMPDSRLVALGTHALGVLLRPSLKRFDHILAVSPVAKEFADGAFGITTQVLPNVVDVAVFARAEPFAQYADKPTILFLNRLVQRKGCKYLLEAIQQIVEQRMHDGPFCVLICGKGELADELQRYVHDSNLDDYVTFTGFVSEEDKPRYIASSDLAVFPSTGGESFGIVLIEAMAASRGVVLGGNNPGYASVLAPRPEQLFDPRDTAAFANLLVDYLKDSDKRNKAVEWQQEYVKQFDTDVVGEQLVRLYQGVDNSSLG